MHRLQFIFVTMLMIVGMSRTHAVLAQEIDVPEIAAMDADVLATDIPDAYGFWAGAMATKAFGKENRWNAGLLAFYCHNFHQGESLFNQVFVRPSITYTTLPWLKVHYDMDLAQTSGGFQMRFMPGATVSHRISDFSFSLRHMFYYIWYPASGVTTHLSATKGTVNYSIPDTPLTLTVAMEPLYRENLLRNRIYAGFNIRLNDSMTLCPQYLRKAYHNRSGKHDRRTYDDHLLYLLLLVRL